MKYLNLLSTLVLIIYLFCCQKKADLTTASSIDIKSTQENTFAFDTTKQYLFITPQRDTLIFQEYANQSSLNLDSVFVKNKDKLIHKRLDHKQFDYLYEKYESNQFIYVGNLIPFIKYYENDKLIYLIFIDDTDYYDALIIYVFNKENRVFTSSFPILLKGGDAEDFWMQNSKEVSKSKFQFEDITGEKIYQSDTCYQAFIHENYTINLNISNQGHITRDTVKTQKNYYVDHIYCD